MRGGALVVLIWASLLFVLYLAHAIYAGEPAQIAITAGSLGMMLLWGLLAALTGREALRRGPPPASRSVEAVPDVSFAAALIGFSVATIGFGFVWGRFLTYFGAGLLVLSLGRLAIELRAQRDSVRAHRPPDPRESSIGGPRPEQPGPAPAPAIERERPEG
jgi:peptidoglycan/LPS O-acetylase OafA/YrhL